MVNYAHKKPGTLSNGSLPSFSLGGVVVRVRMVPRVTNKTTQPLLVELWVILPEEGATGSGH